MSRSNHGESKAHFVYSRRRDAVARKIAGVFDVNGGFAARMADEILLALETAGRLADAEWHQFDAAAEALAVANRVKP